MCYFYFYFLSPYLYHCQKNNKLFFFFFYIKPSTLHIFHWLQWLITTKLQILTGFFSLFTFSPGSSPRLWCERSFRRKTRRKRVVPAVNMRKRCRKCWQRVLRLSPRSHEVSRGVDSSLLSPPLPNWWTWRRKPGAELHTCCGRGRLRGFVGSDPPGGRALPVRHHRCEPGYGREVHVPFRVGVLGHWTTL